jgi:hypothetical protein
MMHPMSAHFKIMADPIDKILVCARLLWCLEGSTALNSSKTRAYFSAVILKADDRQRVDEDSRQGG